MTAFGKGSENITRGSPGHDVQFPPDLGTRLPEGVPIHLWHGLDDEVVPPSHLELYVCTIPQARVHRLPGRDHQFNNDLKEIAAVILSLSARGLDEAPTETGRQPR